MIIRTALMVATLASLAPPAQGRRTVRDDFAWREPMAEGALLRIHNYQGPVEVRESRGNRVEVMGRAFGPAGTRVGMRFQVVHSGDDVTICAMPHSDAGCRTAELRTTGARREWKRGGTTFLVLLPKGVRIHAHTDNGAVTVGGANADVTATSGNGPIRVTGSAASVHATTGNGRVSIVDAGGPVVARTGNGSVWVSTAAGPVDVDTHNGSVDVRMARISHPGDMHIRTSNGRVKARIPSDAQRDVEVRTGFGAFTSDFELRTWRLRTRHHARGTIGGGGDKIYLASERGSIELQREK